MAQEDLQRKGLAASDRARAYRVDRILTDMQNQSKRPETGTLQAYIPNSPLGSQYAIVLNDGSLIYGQPITPRALAPGTRVAVYLQDDKCLFDGL